MFIAFDGRASPLTRELILEPAVTVRLVENSKSKAGRDERPLPTVSQHLKCLNWIASAWIDMSGQESHLSAAGHRRHSCRSMTNHVWNSSLMDRRRVSALNPCWRLIHFDSFWFILIHFDSFWFGVFGEVGRYRLITFCVVLSHRWWDDPGIDFPRHWSLNGGRDCDVGFACARHSAVDWTSLYSGLWRSWMRRSGESRL